MSASARYHCQIDVFSSAVISGWVSDGEDPAHAPLTLQFMVAGVPSGLVRADIERHDVERSGLGPTCCGFEWAIPAAVAGVAAQRDVAVDILVLRPDGTFGVVVQRTLARQATMPERVRASMRPALDNAIAQSAHSALSARSGAAVRGAPQRYPLHEKLFAFDGRADGPCGHTLSPYLAFQHTRLKKGETHPLDGSRAARDRFLRWYLDRYVDVRRPMRGPLGADEIAMLNEPLALCGVAHKVSRVSLSYAMTVPEAASLFPLDDLQRYEHFVRWWSVEKAVALHVEDCLVPEYYIDALRRVPVRYMGWNWPLSVHMEHQFNANVRFHVLDAANEPHRLLYHVWLVLEAVSQPGMLRFIPQKAMTGLFDGAPRETPFDLTIQSLHPSGEAISEVFDAQRYADHLAHLGFDLTRRRFLAVDARGNRFEAARFPPAPACATDRVPVQIIGPLAKSSGLGQAARLSLDTLKAAGYAPNVVDFDLDNPAPVGMSTQNFTLSAPVPAQVNLIHLNGETLPMALAYLRDTFNGAYNIGYFFWELSRPSRAQALAFDLVDEVWVATEYGVSIYAAALGDKPVTNVGMAVEPVADPGRIAARSWMSERLPVGADTFVFLAAFDSFSFLERKNPHGVVEAFRAAFDRSDDVHLVLKTHNRDFVEDAHQSLRWERLTEIANSDPRISIMNETLRYSDLMKLKKAADCYVSLHRSEGWGFGLIEAMALGVPVLTTGYSGNMDFTRADNAWLVDYDLVEPRANEYIFVDDDQVWAAPSQASAVRQMRAVRADAAERERRAGRARAFVTQNFSLEAQAAKYRARLEDIRASLA